MWPEPTHSKGGINGLKPWEPIYKYLDLCDLGKSIFGRKKPLADNTMRRIARGLEKFVFNCPEPFIVQVNHGGENFRGQRIQDPLPTLTSKHGFGVVTPVVMPYMLRNNSGAPGSDVRDPVLTITTGGHHGIISPLLIQYHNETAKNGVRGQAVTAPVQTIDTSNRYGLVMAFLSKFYNTTVAGGDRTSTYHNHIARTFRLRVCSGSRMGGSAGGRD